MLTNERSAEFWRGALSVLEGRPCTAEYYRTLLAAAGAREALQGSKEKMALSRIHEIASRQLAEPAGAGDAVAMAKICTEVEAVWSPKEAAQPTAAEVIEAAERALLQVGQWDAFTQREKGLMKDALELIGDWKEAHGGKTV